MALKAIDWIFRTSVKLKPSAHVTKLLSVHPDKQNNLKIINKMILDLQDFVAYMSSQ